MNRYSQLNRVLNLMKLYPNRTAGELASEANHFPPIHTHSLHKRLSELRRLGLAFNPTTRVCEISGRQAHTWQAIEEASNAEAR